MSWLSGKSAEPTMMLSVEPAAWELLLEELMGSPPPQALRAMAVAAARAKPVMYFFMSILSGEGRCRACGGRVGVVLGGVAAAVRASAADETGSWLGRDGGFHGVSRRGRDGRLGWGP